MADYPDIYADGYAVSIGPFGITLTLQRSDPPIEAGSLSDRNETVGRIRMGTQLAAALAKAINDAIAQQARVQQVVTKTKN